MKLILVPLLSVALVSTGFTQNAPPATPTAAPAATPAAAPAAASPPSAATPPAATPAPAATPGQTAVAPVAVASPPAAAPAPATPAPAAQPAKEGVKPGAATKLKLGVIPLVMKYDKPTLEAKAGAKVMLLFVNEKDPLQHNFVLFKPGKLADYGALADKMLTDPQGMAKAFIPAGPDVLAKSSKLIGIGQSDLIEFTLPSTPGDYPFVCTFPAHWRTMNGILKVTP